MTTIFYIIGTFVFIALVAFLFMAVVTIYRHISWFHLRRCKQCGSIMKYFGVREIGGEEYQLFHCSNSKCGAWKSVLREEFFRMISKPL